MRTALIVLLVLGVASVAMASNVEWRSVKPMPTINSTDQDLLWTQFPPHVYWWTTNASTAFNSELADDIPEALGPMAIQCVSFIALEWAGYWIDPAGFYINIYNEDCPPPLDPVQSYYISWNDPCVGKTLVYSSPGWMDAYQVDACCWMTNPICINPPASIGFQLDLYWGQTAPYGGCTLTDDYVTYGCGQAYWDGTYWGYPRWGTISGYFGVQVDVCYALYGNFGPTANEASTWGAVKSLYD